MLYYVILECYNFEVAMRKTLFALLLFAVVFFAFPAPKAQAFVDPVTIGILTPVALEVASVMAPYVMRGLMNGGKQLVKMGVDGLNFMRFPYGLLQSTVAAPWAFRSGLVNMIKGGIAPFQMMYHAVTLPIHMLNVF
jgi:hypothetical protein